MSPVPRSRPSGRQLAPAVESLRVGDTPIPAESQTPVVREQQTSTDSGSAEPRWRRLLRKEARIRWDQASALTELRRRLNRQRANRDEALTDNTLIRIAIDLLLARAEELSGDTEDALRASLLSVQE